jgi:ubiquinone/menaquinone biosynthesis C-methylase UbiE
MHRAPPVSHSARSYLPAMGRDALLPLYDTVSRLMGVSSLHRQLVEQAEIEPGHRVLEVGCGTGSLTLLAKRVQPLADFVALDPDPRALRRAHRKAQRQHVTVRLDQGFAEDLPYPDGSFDRVLSSLMLHHLERPAKTAMLQQVARVLRPGGSLHLLDIDGPMGGHDPFLARRLHGGPRLQDNRRDIITALMREAGLSNPAEVAHRVKRIGRLTYYRAQARSG